MRKILNSIKTIIQRRPSFDTTDDITLVTTKVESNVTKFSFKDIIGLEKLLLMRVTKEELKNTTKKLFKKIKGIKGKITNRLKANQEKKLRIIVNGKRRQAIIDAIPEIRKYHDDMDDKEQTKQIVEKFEEDYKREKEKNNFDIKKKKRRKKYRLGISITETEEDPLHRK